MGLLAHHIAFDRARVTHQRRWEGHSVQTGLDSQLGSGLMVVRRRETLLHGGKAGADGGSKG